MALVQTIKIKAIININWKRPEHGTWIVKLWIIFYQYAHFWSLLVKWITRILWLYTSEQDTVHDVPICVQIIDEYRIINLMHNRTNLDLKQHETYLFTARTATKVRNATLSKVLIWCYERRVESNNLAQANEGSEAI